MKTINSVPVELTVVLGRTSMLVQQLLRRGRGQVVVMGDRIGVAITLKLKRRAVLP